MGFLAPAGTRLTLTDVAVGLAAGRSTGAATTLAEALRRTSGSARAWTCVSGRAAMTLALEALAAAVRDGQRQVIVPAYTCYSVPAAIERAGLVAVPCDVDPTSLSPDLDHLERLAAGPAIALVSANLFGIPDRLDEMERIARRHGLAMIDDAAQALGASLAGRAVGGFGEFGLYSFDKGKNISTMQGGALVARPGPWLADIEARCAALASAKSAASAATAARLFAYAAMLRPAGYALVRRLPMLGLGETPYETDYPVTRLDDGLAGVALRQLGRLGGYRERRGERAVALRAALEDLPGLRFVEPPRGAESAYPRFPLRAPTPAARAALLTACQRAGIGASTFYPRALPDVVEVARRMPASVHAFAGAREVANTLLTLPTHDWCPPELPARVRQVASEALTAV